MDRAERDAAEYARRLNHFITRTASNEMFGNWDDRGLPRTEG